MGYSSKTTKKLLKEIAHDYNQYQDKLFANLVRGTPIDTGDAQRGWKNVFEISKLILSGSKNKKVIIKNDVPYIERLDKGSSRQASKGIVKPAFNKTRKP
jgi:hypothetical protein